METLTAVLNPVEVQLDGSESLTQLVRPTRRAVPYQAPAHLEWLVNWATDRDNDDAVKVAVVHGAGGTGKTRLCVELGVALTEGSWVTGFVPRGIQGSVDEAVFAALERSSGDTLVVVDYADGRNTDDLLRLLAAARSHSGEGRLRVVLSSRQDLGWWDRLEALMGESGMTIETTVLDELRSQSQLGGRVASAALRRFAVTSRDLMVTDNWVMLDLVLAAALLSVDPGTEVPASRAALYREVLNHEYKSWDTKSLNEMSEADWQIAAAAITLVAPETRRDARAVVAAARVEAFLQGRPVPTSAVVDSFAARWGDGDLHSYPEGLALRPDRVGDHLVRTITSTDTKLVRALLDWIGELGATQIDKATELAERLLTNASRAVPTLM